MKHFEFPVWDAIHADSFTEVTTFACAGKLDLCEMLLYANLAQNFRMFLPKCDYKYFKRSFF